MTIEYGRPSYAISTHHGESGTIFTICLLHGPNDTGWEPLASVRPGQWIGFPSARYRIVGPRGRDRFVVDSRTSGMDQILMAGHVLDLLDQDQADQGAAPKYR